MGVGGNGEGSGRSQSGGKESEEKGSEGNIAETLLHESQADRYLLQRG